MKMVETKIVKFTMIKITEEVFFNVLDNEYCIAIDKDGKVYAYKDSPTLYEGFWSDACGYSRFVGEVKLEAGDSFQNYFVK